MANEITTARSKIKTKLDIQDTTFDAMLLECIEQAVPRLAPYVQYDAAADTSVTLATGDSEFTKPITNSFIRKIFSRTNTNDVWREIDLWQQHANKVYLNESAGTTTYIKVLAQRAYAYSDADLALLATYTPAALLPLYLFAMAEFYTAVVGNKRKFNIYQQMNGVRTVQEMADTAVWCENRAKQILEDEISAEGQ